MQLHNGMVVFWQDPEGLSNPDNDASCYDILCDVNYEEGCGMLANGTEVFLSECYALTDDELNDYIEMVDSQVYPSQIKEFYGRQGINNVL